MINLKQFIFIRHGQTDWNVRGTMQGSTDIPLNEIGIEQAYEAQRILKSQPIATICHSPLSRAKKTAMIINEALNCPMVEIEDLSEWHFGPYEGADYEDWMGEMFRGTLPEIPEGIEKRDRFFTRVYGAINQALAQPGLVLIVAHGAVYIPANESLAQSQRIGLPNCVPVRHDPPSIPDGNWTKLELR